MIIKNTGNKIISIGNHMLLPDSQIRVGAGMGDNPAIAALAEKGFISIVDEVDEGKPGSSKKNPENKPAAAAQPKVQNDPVLEEPEEPAPSQNGDSVPNKPEEAKGDQGEDKKPEGEAGTGEAAVEAKAPKRNFRRTTTAAAAPAATTEDK